MMKNINKTSVKCFSRGIKKIPHLHAFIPELDIVDSAEDAVIGWGFKTTAKKARAHARNKGLPYVALEDGFLRSVGLGVDGVVAASIVVDTSGIYYDARQSSDLELLLLAAKNLTEEQLSRAKRCIAAIKDKRLSKYNVNQASTFLEAPKVVVIDQTKGDASVDGAMADESTFINMLKQALKDHPNESIWLKVHPDVLTGKKQGFLYPLPVEDERIKLCSEAVNPWDFLESVTDLYTVSSLMGYEALMGGVNVHCFGLPFYAGWGLTHDSQKSERRNVSRSLEQVFYAAYIQYARYVDPVLGEPCEIEDIINYFSDILRQGNQAQQDIDLSQLSLTRKYLLSHYLRCWKFSHNKQSAITPLWGRKQSTPKKAWRIEDGFIRSVGLGVQLSKPASLVLDKSGIYFDATTESDLEKIYRQLELSGWDKVRTSELIKTLRKAKVTKYNVGNNEGLTLPHGKRVLLVPGQVETDASIQFGSPEIKTNKTLLMKVRENNPHAFIIYKPHPDVLAGDRDFALNQGAEYPQADIIVKDINMDSLLERVDEVHTMTSLTGFEGLLRGKIVHTYGMPFYAGWGLTVDYLICDRRTRSLTLQELVYGALVLYPTYVDICSNQMCTVEQTIQRISQQKAGRLKTKFNLVLFALLQARRLRDRVTR
ncbi:capsular polysaccharide biosynthesis protein [Enterovibrio norvegicus]|uniref:capsular polysaccharide biosynthesis protein n=1 Tax=Enterovibrio norvegicus TaxID=188144 RepID=UPI001F536F5B|nr:capsular polysaccharide biosynthesis protein [Enterovibrio norvegicus]